MAEAVSTPKSAPAGINPVTVIVCGCLIALIAFGVRSTMGLFNGPITEANGWRRETFGLAMALQNLVWGAAQPFAGAFADKFGTSRVIMLGALVYAAGTALMVTSDSGAMMYLSGGVLMGLGIAMTSFSIIMAAFGRLVPPEKRSWSFGIATAASSMGQFVFAPLGQAFIASFGWQTALYLLAGTILLMWLLVLPLRAAKGGTARDETEVEMNIGQALSRAISHPSFVLLTLGFFVCGFQVAFLTVHMPPMLVENGIAPQLAAWSIAIVGLFNVIGAYSSGIIGGKYSRRWSLTLLYLARSVVMTAFFVLPITPGLVSVLQTEPLPAMLAQVFGVANADCAGRQQIDGRLRVTTGIGPWNAPLAGWQPEHFHPRTDEVATMVHRIGAILPALREAPLARVWAGLVAVTRDALPVLDAPSEAPGLVVAGGFSGHGFCLGPVTGQLLADLALGRTPRHDIGAFGLARLHNRGEAAELTLHG